MEANNTSTSSQEQNLPPLNLAILSLSNENNSEGWDNYTVQVALKNQTAQPLAISDPFQYNGTVYTSEGPSYEASLTSSGYPIVIPPQFRMKGRVGSGKAFTNKGGEFTVTFKVAQSTNPIRIEFPELNAVVDLTQTPPPFVLTDLPNSSFLELGTSVEIPRQNYQVTAKELIIEQQTISVLVEIKNLDQYNENRSATEPSCSLINGDGFAFSFPAYAGSDFYGKLPLGPGQAIEGKLTWELTDGAATDKLKLACWVYSDTTQVFEMSYIYNVK
jgi:hypothetical protein